MFCCETQMIQWTSLAWHRDKMILLCSRLLPECCLPHEAETMDATGRFGEKKDWPIWNRRGEDLWNCWLERRAHRPVSRRFQAQVTAPPESMLKCPRHGTLNFCWSFVGLPKASCSLCTFACKLRKSVLSRWRRVLRLREKVSDLLLANVCLSYSLHCHLVVWHALDSIHAWVCKKVSENGQVCLLMTTDVQT